MEERIKEAVRYLGYGKNAVDEKTLAMIREAFYELDQIVRKRIVYRIFNLHVVGDDCIIIEDFETISRDLGRNVKECSRILMLGATLGIEADQLMQRYSLTDMARVVVLQACGTALLEEYLDDWQEQIREQFQEEGLFLRPRFSPGYGDFSILCQEDLLRMLDAPKKIGLSITEGSMLTPTKSVTALIGLSDEQTDCHKKGCESCGKTDCIYRRN